MKMDILNEFGKGFIKKTRDETIERMEAILSGKMNDDQSQMIYQKAKDMNIETILFINKIIIETIEEMTINVLDFFDESGGKYLIGYNNGEETISINEFDKELTDELYGDDGWIKKYSKKQYIDL